MTKSLNLKFEKGVRFLVEHFPLSDENSRKPVMFHDIRVGVFLYNHGYSEEVVLAGLLKPVSPSDTSCDLFLKARVTQ